MGSGTSHSFIEGIRRVNRAPVILVCVFLVTLVTALPLSMAMRAAIAAHLGRSLAAEEAVRGVNYQWWTEFTGQGGELAASLKTSIIGFAASLDNLSALLDGDGRPVAVLWIGAAYLILWLFLAGGILDRYARNRPTRSHEFFTACGVYFVRFLRLAAIMAAAYYVLLAWLRPLLLDDVYEQLTRDVTVERTAFLWRLGLYLVFGASLILVNMLFDYAKVRAVVEDRRSMIGAVVSSARFLRRNFGGAASLYLLNGCLFVAVLLLYALIAPGAGSGLAGIWAGLLVGQLYLAARLWVRLVFAASEVSLFQARLAHAGYVANAPAPAPEPPIVEQVLRTGEPRVASPDSRL
jgi:hypothetical protein